MGNEEKRKIGMRERKDNMPRLRVVCVIVVCDTDPIEADGDCVEDCVEHKTHQAFFKKKFLFT